MNELIGLVLNISINKSIKELFPDLKIGSLLFMVNVSDSDDRIINEMNKLNRVLIPNLTPESIRRHTIVEATKNAYRKMGKDPNRYRPAAESLLRRLAQKRDLYFVNNVVDILNMVSLASGFSIGGYDADKIVGQVMLGIGQASEPYEGIGRGKLNIENLPVFRDEKGSFGSPTSDSVRTMVDHETKRFLMLFPSFNGELLLLKEAMKSAKQWLMDLSNAELLKSKIYDTK